MPFSRSALPDFYKQPDLRVFTWSFAIGAFLVVFFIFLYTGLTGLQHIHGTQPWWEVEFRDVIVTLIGSGLLLGCIAVIGKHLMKR